MSWCAVVGCLNKTSQERDKHFFQLPRSISNRSVRGAWIAFSRRNHVARNALFCSDHFTEDCFKHKARRESLQPDAVPTLRPNYNADDLKTQCKIGNIKHGSSIIHMTTFSELHKEINKSMHKAMRKKEINFNDTIIEHYIWDDSEIAEINVVNMTKGFTQQFPTNYTLADEISRGSFSVTKRCINLLDKQELSVRVIDVNLMQSLIGFTQEDIEREVDICKQLNHPNIVKLYDGYIVDDGIYVVGEIITGRNLCEEVLSKVNNGFVYSESVASYYMHQVVEGLSYIHCANVVHRDIRLENMVLASTHDAATVKIVDFAIAFQLPDDKSSILSEPIGTVTYMPPEVAQRKPYNYLADVWACGIALHILLVGEHPFSGSKNEVFQQIQRGSVTLKSPLWISSISESARNVVQRMLESDPLQRITANELLKHPWFKERENPSRVHLQGTIDVLHEFYEEKKIEPITVRPADEDIIDFAEADLVQSQPEEVISKKDYDSPELQLQFESVRESVASFVEANEERSYYIQQLLKEEHLNQAHQIYSLCQRCRSGQPIKTLQPNALQLLDEVKSALNGSIEPKDEELKNLLNSIHLKESLSAHDQVIEQEQPTTDFDAGDDGDRNSVVSVRLVHFHRGPDEQLGITMKVTEEGQCVVARVIHGGMIHKQGTLNVGDEVREVNGVALMSKPAEKVQQILRNAVGDVVFKIVPGKRTDEFSPKERWHVRCLFDYDPLKDDLIPCQQAGLKFQCADILQIKSKTDPCWWQATKVHDKTLAGLIPSPELQERRLAEQAKSFQKHKEPNILCMFPRKKKLKQKSKYIARKNTEYDSLDLLTYEEVVYKENFSRKSLVLIGAKGVGRRHIKNTLVSRQPHKYAIPTPHTSRRREANERNGDCWQFVDEETMLTDIKRHEYLEFGQHDGELYGTKISAVRDVMNEGKIPVLDVETPALKLLRCKQHSPYIVFVSSPSSYPPTGDLKMDANLQRLIAETEELRSKYSHLFDFSITNESIDETVSSILNHVIEKESQSDWLPASWVY